MIQSSKSSEIKNIKAGEILDSRGEATVEAQVLTDIGVFKASVPSGASKGKHEAVALPAAEAAENVNKIIAPKLKGEKASGQREIDQLLIELDGTGNKSKLGVNAILPVSIAVCRAGAAAKNLPLYKYIRKISRGSPSGDSREVSPLANLPRPCFNILEGGRHADNDLDVQEFMVAPQTESFKENLKIGVEVCSELGEILKNKFKEKTGKTGDEGGFSPPLGKTKEALDLVILAIDKSGYGESVEIGLDCAASEFYENGKYNFEGEKSTGEELLDFYEQLIKNYPILFIEDPFGQDDWQNWTELNSKLQITPKNKPTGQANNKQLQNSNSKTQNTKVLIIGDDLTVTNPKRIKEAKEKKACNGVIIKPNQIGTVTETLEAVSLAKSFGWKIIVSHRSGETLDDFIADLAVGAGADFIKSGAPGPEERMSKYNRLSAVEQELWEK